MSTRPVVLPPETYADFLKRVRVIFPDAHIFFEQGDGEVTISTNRGVNEDGLMVNLEKDKVKK
jgi:hypothetical protein